MEPWKLEPAHDLGLSPLERLRSPSRESGLVSTLLHHTWWTLARCYLSIWHRFEVHHAERLPRQPPFVLVANHSSHLDAIALGAALPGQLRNRCFALAAGDVFFSSPVATTLAAYFLNALPLWRKRSVGRSLQVLRQRLIGEPCGFIAFPEGTRSRDGTMGAFKAGIGMLVASTDVPVVPCFLNGCFRALKPGQRLPRRTRIGLHVGEPMRFDDTTDDRAGWETAAKQLEKAVKRLSPRNGDRW
jgi:1-acyl-sn-glycerol-3-phosphate acyltransferase